MTSRQRAAERSLDDQNHTLPKGQVILVFSSLALALLVAFIDQNGIGVSLPTIAKDLHAEDTISWAGTSSLIANAAFQMLYGRLSDIFGRKVVYLAAISFLATAALLCGFSQNDTMFYGKYYLSAVLSFWSYLVGISPCGQAVLQKLCASPKRL